MDKIGVQQCWSDGKQPQPATHLHPRTLYTQSRPVRLRSLGSALQAPASALAACAPLRMRLPARRCAIQSRPLTAARSTRSLPRLLRWQPCGFLHPVQHDASDMRPSVSLRLAPCADTHPNRHLLSIIRVSTRRTSALSETPPNRGPRASALAREQRAPRV
ncbi:hypothetical protein L227DRAFT_317427 [Lentinus tigrinus ALCF2SS1-6]|uniref:Uncharacterized protein n=1 Tax=Lentinus tigrinus ALCF2SS1-6 TaxID=1328759 RepID=A0A5C2SK19_9APHY|nr:hypothetical protein L227DRAFT_317427 [Lentinus tigrinus ALCF2SS1-6]